MSAPLLTEQDTAASLGLTVDELRALEDGPARVRVGAQTVRYDPDELAAWQALQQLPADERELLELTRRAFGDDARLVAAATVEPFGERPPRPLPPPVLSRPEAPYWTGESIIAALQGWARLHGRSPRASDWKGATVDRPTQATVWRRFDGWDAALRAAGLTPARPRPSRPVKITIAFAVEEAAAVRAIASREGARTSELIRRRALAGTETRSV